MGGGVGAAGAADDFVGGGVAPRGDAAVVAEQITFAAGGLLFHFRLPFVCQCIGLGGFVNQLAQRADALRIGGDAVVRRNVDGADAGVFQALINRGGLHHPRADRQIRLGGDNRFDGELAVNAYARFVFQRGILIGLVAGGDFTGRAQRHGNIGHIGRQHHNALCLRGLQGGK